MNKSFDSAGKEVNDVAYFKIVTVIAILILVSSAVMARHHLPEERGKTLFNDKSLGTNGNTCGTCHPDGQGLEAVAGKKEWKTPAGSFKTLEEAINICITMALKGKALDVKSDQMKNLVAYINSLGKTAKAAKI